MENEGLVGSLVVTLMFKLYTPAGKVSEYAVPETVVVSPPLVEPEVGLKLNQFTPVALSLSVLSKILSKILVISA